MKIKLIFLLFLIFTSLTFAQDLRSFTIEDEELNMEWQRFMVMQGLTEENLSEQERLNYLDSLKESLLIRKIMLALADERSIVVDDTDLEQIYLKIRNQVPTQADWDKLLEQQYYDEVSFRKYLRNSERIDRLLRMEVLEKIELTQQEIQSYYDNHPDEFLNEGETLSFEEVEESLREFLWDQKAQRAVGEYMDKIKAAMSQP
ncbi:MAG: hypothetical protein PF447_12430 [Spirochaetaceae bacterium]|jgi:hypothetical protein|nr:hypothetical protein [Spirochaetaceae bacterium]